MKLDVLKQLTKELPPLEGKELEAWLRDAMQRLGYDPKTIYQEIEMSSRFVETHRDVTYSNDTLQLHSHAFYEIVYSCNDCGAEYFVGSERYRLGSGDIIFIPPGVSHRALLPDTLDEPYLRYIIWMSQEFIEYYCRLFSYPLAEKFSAPNMLRTKNTKWEHLGALFQYGVREAEEGEDGCEAVVLGNTLQLLAQIKRAVDAEMAEQPQAEKTELLDRLAEYIERHYTETITIGDLSRRFYVSKSTISHLFQQKLGVSRYRYVTQRRLIAAKSLVEEGVRLEEVAMRIGFQDYTAFFRAFKGAYGISPRQYRVMHGIGD